MDFLTFPVLASIVIALWAVVGCFGALATHLEDLVAAHQLRVDAKRAGRPGARTDTLDAPMAGVECGVDILDEPADAETRQAA